MRHCSLLRVTCDLLGSKLPSEGLEPALLSRAARAPLSRWHVAQGVEPFRKVLNALVDFRKVLDSFVDLGLPAGLQCAGRILSVYAVRVTFVISFVPATLFGLLFCHGSFNGSFQGCEGVKARASIV